MFPNSLMQLTVSKRTAQISSSSVSLGQILCGVKNQILTLLSSKSWLFFVFRKSCPDPGLIEFRSKGNYKSKSVSKRVVQCHS